MFKVGDTVKLKSGGPVMTVTSIDSAESTCTWFHDSTPQWYVFVNEALRTFDMN